MLLRRKTKLMGPRKRPLERVASAPGRICASRSRCHIFTLSILRGRSGFWSHYVQYFLYSMEGTGRYTSPRHGTSASKESLNNINCAVPELPLELRNVAYFWTSAKKAKPSEYQKRSFQLCSPPQNEMISIKSAQFFEVGSRFQIHTGPKSVGNADNLPGCAPEMFQTASTLESIAKFREALVTNCRLCY